MPSLEWLPYSMLAVGAAIWIVATWRKGRLESGELWKDEVEALEKKTDRLERELKEERDKSRHLEGRVEQLTLDNHNLQALALGELPKALEDTLVTMGSRIVRRMDQAEKSFVRTVEDSEDRISQGVLHMADAISKVMAQLREDVDEIKGDVKEIKIQKGAA